MGGLIEKLDADKAVKIIKDWIENPLKEGIFEKVKVALWSLEDDLADNFDDERVMEVLGREEY
jgi:hypothetical protein